MIKVLFVCLGNICRSPMAEGMFRKMIKDRGLEQSIHVESRATSTYEIGNPPHPKTQHILNRIQADFSNIYSKQITQDDFRVFDFVIGMDLENVRYLKAHAGPYQSKIYLLRDINPLTKNEIIPDPYYTGKYEETYHLLKESLELWIKFLEAQIVL